MYLRKATITLLCLTILLNIFAISTNAAITTETSNKTTVSYMAEESFVVTVPAGISIDENTGKATLEISASDVILSADSCLNISISSDNYDLSWKLIDVLDSTNQLSYTIGTAEDKSDIFNNSLVLSIGAGEAYNSTITKTIYLSVAAKAIKAGTYSDILVFSVNIEKTS